MIGKPILIAGEQTSPSRSLEAVLADLQDRYDRLSMTDPERGRLALKIVQIESEIDARQPL